MMNNKDIANQMGGAQVSNIMGENSDGEKKDMARRHSSRSDTLLSARALCAASPR
jgi:hypothetical protein